MYYPMLKHGIYQLCIRRTPLSVLGKSGGLYWAQTLVSRRMSLNKFPRPFTIPKNKIIRSKHDASARHPKTHAIPYTVCPPYNAPRYNAVDRGSRKLARQGAFFFFFF